MRSSAEEHRVHTAGVAGSNPAAPTIRIKRLACPGHFGYVGAPGGEARVSSRHPHLGGIAVCILRRANIDDFAALGHIKPAREFGRATVTIELGLAAASQAARGNRKRCAARLPRSMVPLGNDYGIRQQPVAGK